MTAIQAITFLILGLVALVTDQNEISYILFGFSVISGIINDVVATIRIIKERSQR